MRKTNILTAGAVRHRCHCVLTIILLFAASSAARAQTSHFASAYYNRGNGRYKKGDLDGAISDFDAALTFDPRLAVAYNMRGCARYHKQDLDGSIADYTRAIEINPHLVAAYNNRGNARNDKGDLAGAMADFDRAIQL